jgi:hypothetical protein
LTFAVPALDSWLSYQRKKEISANCCHFLNTVPD